MFKTPWENRKPTIQEVNERKRENLEQIGANV